VDDVSIARNAWRSGQQHGGEALPHVRRVCAPNGVTRFKTELRSALTPAGQQARVKQQADIPRASAHGDRVPTCTQIDRGQRLSHVLR
jgi:hypothetical protein